FENNLLKYNDLWRGQKLEGNKEPNKRNSLLIAS
ncbi:MAG: hypothetical protein ACJA1P_002530, partial [Maribacter sp.]